MEYNFKELWNQQSLMKELTIYTLNLLNKSVNSAEVFITKTLGISLNTRKCNIENLEFQNDSIIYITVYKNFKKGIAYSSDLSVSGIKKTVNAALNIMKYTSLDFDTGLPDPTLLCFDKVKIKLFYPWDFNILKAIKWSSIIEQSALKYDSKIINVENTYFNSYINNYVFGNTHGMLQGYKTTLHSMSSSVISKKNNIMQRDYSYTVARKILDLKSPVWIGVDSAKKSISRLGAKKIKTRNCPVVISSCITDDFFSSFISSISGINVYKKSTFLLNSMGKKIFPDWFSIVENPHLDKGLSSKPFDSEGVKTKNRSIVKKGILKTWLLNNYYAKKIGLVTTGHSGGIYNWLISSFSNISFKDLLKTMYRGLIVTEFMGQGVNIMTGNYSRGIFGFWVEQGEIKYPVHEVTISGNLKYMWKNIISISNDIETRTGIHCGSILLSDIQVSGI